MNLFRSLLVCLAAVVMYARPAYAQIPHVVFVAHVLPPPSWERIYHEVEQCVGKPGDFAAVDWYVTNRPMIGERGDITWGLWHKHTNDDRASVIIVGTDTSIVRHEALHDVLYRSGFRSKRVAADSLTTDPEHPQPPFGRCAFRYYTVPEKR